MLRFRCLQRPRTSPGKWNLLEMTRTLVALLSEVALAATPRGSGITPATVPEPVLGANGQTWVGALELSTSALSLPPVFLPQW